MTFKNGLYEFTFNASGNYETWGITITAVDSSGLESIATMNVLRTAPEITINFTIVQPSSFQNVESNFTLLVNVTFGVDVM